MVFVLVLAVMPKEIHEYRCKDARETIFFGDSANKYKLRFLSRMCLLDVVKKSNMLLAKRKDRRIFSNAIFYKWHKRQEAWVPKSGSCGGIEQVRNRRLGRVDLRVKCVFLVPEENGILYHRLVHFLVENEHTKTINAKGYARFARRYANKNMHVDHVDGKWWRIDYQGLAAIPGSVNSAKSNKR